GASKMSGDVAFEALTRVATWRFRELMHRLATAVGVRRPANPGLEARRAV
ncbi:MAG: hypothetical protein JWN91_96, partial [Nocardioides sp.]|nr:hypothetical protein [Nocardioides sp.]